MSPPPRNPMRDVRCAELDDRVAEIVAAAPPLSPTQCHQLAVLLAPEPVTTGQHAA